MKLYKEYFYEKIINPNQCRIVGNPTTHEGGITIKYKFNDFSYPFYHIVIDSAYNEWLTERRDKVIDNLI